MGKDRRKSLAVITSLGGRKSTSGRYQLTQTFLEEMQTYAKAWDGDVCAYFHPSAVARGNPDGVEVAPSEVNFGMRVVRFDNPTFYAELEGRGVVLGNHHLLPDLASRCLELGVPCVYNPAYTLRARLRMLSTAREGMLPRLRGGLWELREEARVKKQARIADGIQCNGLPAYMKYGSQNRSPLLYFDSRVSEDALLTEQELLANNQRRQRKQPLHLVFSARLLREKGAEQHLLRVAQLLHGMKVAFRMTVCGDGPPRPAVKAELSSERFGSASPGALNFSSEPLPFMKREADLFVGCHRQGDPSTTYLEAFSCGVPIVGYENEALSTLLVQTEAGQAVRRGDAEALAKLIAELDDDRGRLCLWAYRAQSFASEHTMERTFKARIRHLLGIRDGFLRRGRPIVSSPDLRSLAGSMRLG